MVIVAINYDLVIFVVGEGKKITLQSHTNTTSGHNLEKKTDADNQQSAQY